MANVGSTVDAFLRLKLDRLDDEWVKETWDTDFTGAECLPLALEEDLSEDGYHGDDLHKLRAALLPWAHGDQASSGQGFWTVLVENNISHKSIIAFLFYIMEAGQKRTSSVSQKMAATYASSVYLHLAAVPGSRAFKVFHPVLFEKTIATFKAWSRLEAAPSASRKRKPSPVRPSQSQRTGKRSRRQIVVQQDEDLFDESDEEEEDGGGLSVSDLNKLHKTYLTFLQDFVDFLSSYTLSDSEDSAHQVLQALGELVKLDSESFDGKFDSNMPNRVITSVPQLAYRGLFYLCSNHGDVTSMTTSALKHLMPCLLMLIGENKGVAAQTIPRSVQVAKDHALAFVVHLMEVHKEKVLPCVRILLQHMCVKVPDKADYRNKVAHAVVDIMHHLPAASYARTIEWLHKYSRHNKISHRAFALDIVCLLLLGRERVTTGTVDDQLTVFLSPRFLLQMLLSRCSDIASTVRARAIQGFAQCSASTEPFIQNAIKEIITPQVAGGRPTMMRVIPTPDAHRTATNEAKSPGTPDEQAPSSNEQEQTIECASGMEKTGEGSSESNSETPLATGPNAETPGCATSNGTPNVGDQGKSTGTTPITTVLITPGLEITLSDGKGMSSMLRRRAGDEKVNVRKAALQALENIIRLDGDNFNKEDLNVLHDRCQDPALSVRKQSMMSLTDLMYNRPHNSTLHEVWLDAVFPLVLDRETSAQEKCLEILEDSLLNNVVPYQRSTDDCHKMTWSLLSIMAGNNGSDLRRFFQKACQQWGRAGKLKSSLLINHLQTHIGTENNAGVWMLLSEVAAFVTKFNYTFVVEYWKEHANDDSESEFQTLQRVLSVLSKIAKFIPLNVVSELADDLKGRLVRFDSSPELVSVTIDTLNKLCQARTDDVDAVRKLTDGWFADLLMACDAYLSEVILAENDDSEVDEDKIVRYLFTLGEIAQLCPAKTPKRVFMLVQSLIAAPVITTVDGSTQVPRESTIPNSVDDSTSSQVSQSTQPSQQSSQVSSQVASQFVSQTALSQFRGSRMSNKVRTHAFITLGKLCLQNEDIAKKCIAALARELEASTDPAIRNNVVIILCDLSVRYTLLVDRYVPNISCCLRDETALVRKQTLTLLTHLLQEDFLKWKGSLFFRFIMAIVDENKDIKEFAEFCLVHLLMQRHPTMFFNHFIECIFTFNNYNNHPSYNKFPQTDREKERFSLKGKQNREKRMRIYRFMLENMTDEHRFQLTSKLTTEVLSGIVDGVMQLDSDTGALLQDALRILACKEIKLASLRTRPTDDIVEEADMAQAVMNAAKKTIISQVLKKNVIENVVPVVISLKHMLEKHHSPVLRDLMVYLRELMKDYKNEVKDIMAADRQLATEIEFDLRKFEEAQQEAEKQRQEQLQRRRSSVAGQGPSPLASPFLSPSMRAPRVGGTPGVGRTPRLGGTPQMRGTPRGGTTTPQVAKTPLAVQPSPFLSPGPRSATPRAPCTPKMATPGRALATVAVVNSARKAMEKARRLSQTVPASAQKKKVAWADEQPSGASTSLDGSEEAASVDSAASNSSETFGTPYAVRQRITTPERRAISTPFGNNNSLLSNMTFDQNLSMIAPSTPIPSSLPIPVYDSDGGKDLPRLASWTAQTEEEKEGHRDVLQMFSPAHPPRKPRKWNVRAPAPVYDMNDTETEEADPSTASNKETRQPAKDITPAATNVAAVTETNSTQKTRGRRSRTSVGQDTPTSDVKTKPKRTSTRKSQEGASQETPARATRSRSTVSESDNDVSVSEGRRRSARKSRN